MLFQPNLELSKSKDTFASVLIPTKTGKGLPIQGVVRLDRLRELAETDRRRLPIAVSSLCGGHLQRSHGKPDGKAEKDKREGERRRFERNVERAILWFLCTSFDCRQLGSKSRHLGWRFSAG